MMHEGGEPIWTFEALKVHIDALFEAHESLDAARFRSIAEATHVLNVQSEEWRRAANEWRGALNDARAEYLRKGEYNRAHDSLIDQIGFLQKQIADLRGRVNVLMFGIPIGVTVLLAIIHLYKTP